MTRSIRGGSRLDSILLGTCVLVAVSALIMPSASRDSVAASLRATVLAPFVALQNNSARIRATIVARNDELKVRGALATEALSVQGLKDENLALRRLVGLGTRLRTGFVAAEVVGQEEFQLTLNSGSAAGVQQYAPVVNADGLVGMVTTVDPNSSYAITWADPSFRVSAMSADESAFGIVQPHLGAGADRWLLELRGVPFRAKLDTGTVIVSAGLGATYPRGIAIGTVLTEIATPEKWARTYLLRPAAITSYLGPVLVLTGGVGRDVNSVWTSIASADSAVRGVVAAGDSLARKAALDELAARRAALDSMAVDSATRDTTGAVRPAIRPDSARADSVRRAARSDSARRAAQPPPVTKPGPPTGPPPPDR